MKLKYCIGFMLVLLSCKTRNYNSGVKDSVVDENMPQVGSWGLNSTPVVALYRREGKMLVRSECQPGRPPSLATCPHNKMSVNYDPFVAQLKKEAADFLDQKGLAQLPKLVSSQSEYQRQIDLLLKENSADASRKNQLKILKGEKAEIEAKIRTIRSKKDIFNSAVARLERGPVPHDYTIENKELDKERAVTGLFQQAFFMTYSKEHPLEQPTDQSPLSVYSARGTLVFKLKKPSYTTRYYTDVISMQNGQVVKEDDVAVKQPGCAFMPGFFSGIREDEGSQTFSFKNTNSLRNKTFTYAKQKSIFDYFSYGEQMRCGIIHDSDPALLSEQAIFTIADFKKVWGDFLVELTVTPELAW